MDYDDKEAEALNTLRHC